MLCNQGCSLSVSEDFLSLIVPVPCSHFMKFWWCQVFSVKSLRYTVNVLKFTCWTRCSLTWFPRDCQTQFIQVGFSQFTRFRPDERHRSSSSDSCQSSISPIWLEKHTVIWDLWKLAGWSRQWKHCQHLKLNCKTLSVNQATASNPGCSKSYFVSLSGKLPASHHRLQENHHSD